MSYPHDYYHRHGGPDLHNTGESRPYLDPDFLANGHGAQLPALSAIGRGPRGEGIYVDNVVERDGTVSFGLYSSLTGELVWQSPNLAAPEIEFVPVDFRELVPGTAAPLDIVVKRGGVTKTTTAYIPAGERGSLVYLLDGYVERTVDDTYTTTIDDLIVYGRNEYLNKPIPKPNDVVFFKYTGTSEYGFAFGTVETVGNHSRDHEGHTGNQVVFTARTFIPLPPIEVGQNGNWVVGGQDTGIQAQGEKGDKGDKGDRGQDGQRGPQGLRGEKGETGARGRDGRDGEDGAPGLPLTLGVVTTVMGDPGTEPSAVFTHTDIDDNIYDLVLTIPRGEDGAMIDVQNGIYTMADLPEYTPTPINTAFVVDDGNGYDLYIRGRIPVDAEDGGPWVVIENLYDYDHISNAPLKKSQDGTRWISQLGAKLPVEWGTGDKATVQGVGTTASGPYAHAEGQGTRASGNSAHSEGIGTQATGTASHAEGSGCQATGMNAHAEGSGSIAEGTYAHAEGAGSQATGNYSHSEGSLAKASQESSHAEGYNTTASGYYSHAEGYEAKATGMATHAEGSGSQATYNNCHAEGSYTKASGSAAHAEGASTQATGNACHAEGSQTKATIDQAHAEGAGCEATSGRAHAEGYYTKASGSASHSEGNYTKAAGSYSHAEGSYTETDNEAAHAEGIRCVAKGDGTHAEGIDTYIDYGRGSHVEGIGTYCNSEATHVSGKYNDGSKWLTTAARTHAPWTSTAMPGMQAMSPATSWEPCTCCRGRPTSRSSTPASPRSSRQRT